MVSKPDSVEGDPSSDANYVPGIVGPPADHLLGVEGVEGARGPRFRKLTPHEIEDYLTNL